MKPVFMTYTKKDLINLAVCMFLSVLIIPTFITTEYWYTSILIPWLCLALATIGQQIVMGYTGQLALGAAGFMAAGAFAMFNLILRVPDLGFVGSLIVSGLIAAAFGILFGLPSLKVRGIYLMVATLASQFFIIWMIDKFLLPLNLVDQTKFQKLQQLYLTLLMSLQNLDQVLVRLG